MKKSRIIDLILIFYTGSILGWIWEVIESYIDHGMFSNRGLLHGPWLPIYGTGIIVIYFLKKYFDQNPVILFAVNCIAFAVIEFTASWLLEHIFHARWWDYTYEFMNLDGRICLKYVVLFSIAGCFAAYFLLPVLFTFFEHITIKKKELICILLTILFVFDWIYSLYNPNMGLHIANTVGKYVGRTIPMIRY